MNSKNDNTKKDLRLAYSQGNITAYSPTIEAMARYLSTQYPNKNSTNQRQGKKGDRNEKKRNDPKSEDKVSNTTGTSGVHVGDTTTPEESTLPSGGASIGTYVLEAIVQLSCPTRSVEKISGAHPINDDDFWGWD